MNDFDLALRSCRIPTEFCTATLDNFDWAHNAKQNQRTYDLIKNFKRQSKNLFISGDIGTGKTHLIVAVNRKYISLDSYVYFVDQIDLNKSINSLARYDDIDYDQSGLYHKALRVKHLIIDDFGEGEITPRIVENMTYLLKKRLHNYGSTDFTTNYSGKELNEMFGPRLIDRIKQHCMIIELKGKSYRGNK